MHTRKLLIVVFFAMMFAMLSLACAEAETRLPGRFMLPESVCVIEKEAFEGTNAAVIYLPDSVERIEDRAFADILSLKVVYIPPSVRSIGDNILEGSGNTLLAGSYGSYAQEWAHAHGYSFFAVIAWAQDRVKTDYGLRLDRRTSRSVDDRSDGRANGAMGYERIDESFNDPKEKPQMRQLDYDFP